MPKKLMSGFAVFALLLSLATLGFAQQGAESSVKGSLSGVVTDPTEAVISGAKVTIGGPIGNKSMQTDAGRQIPVPGSDSRLLFRQNRERRIQGHGC